MKIEQSLIEGCIANNRKAHYELYKLMYGLLMSVCLRYEKNKEDAESVMHLGFLKIVRNLGKMPEGAPFEAWARRIMINTIIDEYRKNHRKAEIIQYQELLEDYQFNDQVDFNDADKKFDAQSLYAILEKIPPISQKVFNLFTVEGYSHKEIGDMLGMSEGTSKWHLSYARKKIRHLIEEQIAVEKMQQERRALG